MVARTARSRSRTTRLQAEINRLEHELALLQEEMRIKDARMDRIPPARRPHYTPLERMAIMELRAARGWAARQTARRLHVTMTTLASWKARIDEGGPRALLRTAEPVNRFPDLVRYIVRRLKVLCPQLGKVKSAEMLCRAGLHLAPTTVGRMLKDEPGFPEPLEAAAVTRRVTASRPDQIWHIDLTAVPTRLGFWVPWTPGALPQEWPFCYWIAVVLDHFSRRVQGFAAFERKPDSVALRALLGRTVRQAKATPRHLICDQESMFVSKGFRRWCRPRRIRLRYGAVRQHGSISVIERFFRTMKSEGTRRIRVPFRRERLRQEPAFFMRWYNGHRPHGALDVQTPDEVYFGSRPACQQPRIELRDRWPKRSRCAGPQAPPQRDPPKAVTVEVRLLGGRRHLPIVSLRRAA
jgi:putative transposase